MDTSCRLQSRCRDFRLGGASWTLVALRFSIPLSLLGSSEDRGGFRRKRFSDIGNGSQSGALSAPFQLAYIAFGIPEGIGQFQLAPASVDTQLGKLRTHSLT